MKHLQKTERLIYAFIIMLIIIAHGLYGLHLYETTVRDEGMHAIHMSRLVAALIDVDKYMVIVNTKEKNHYYIEMQKIFRAMQSKLKYAEYIYVENQISDSKIEYIFDSVGDSLGDLDDNVEPEYYKNTQSFYTGLVKYERWGTMLTGYTPLLYNGKVVGLVGVDINIGSVLDTFYKRLVVLIMYTAALIILIVVLFYEFTKQKNKHIRELEMLMTSVLKSLTKSLSHKSDYTYKHSDNVMKYSTALAEQMNIKHDDIKIIQWAALLHDVGKIGISDKILNKTEPLTDEEFAEIKKHTIYGKEILDEILVDNTGIDIGEYKIINDIVCYHHERWDGRGYPFGLNGYEIPIFASIVSLADALEAMTAERPYKKKRDLAWAVEEIKRGSGKQFSPNVVQAFLKCVENNTIKMDS